ncbi:hypothetical protein EV715DRAFT_273232 [Schizophyllum commune]
MKSKSLAKELSGTVKEILGTAQSVGCTVDGQPPHDIIEGIDSGDVERFYRDMRQRQNVRSPVNRLPRELLEVICEYTVPWFWYTLERLSGIGNLVFAQVCHYWRDIAFNLHRLWTRISLDDFSCPCRNPMHYWEDVVQAYLERSYIQEEAHRVRDLEIGLPTFRWNGARFLPHLPILTTLRLGAFNPIDGNNIVRLPLRQKAPALRSLTLASGALRELELKDCFRTPLEDILEVLSLCTQMEALRILITPEPDEDYMHYLYPDEGEEYENWDLAEIPRLLRIELAGLAIPLSNYIITLALQELSLDMMEQDGLIPQRIVRPGHNFPSLKALTFKNMVDNDPAPIMDNLESVQRLHLVQASQYCHTHSGMFTALEARANGTDVPLPNLVELQIEARPQPEDEWDSDGGDTSSWHWPDDERVMRTVYSRVRTPAIGGVARLQRLSVVKLVTWLESLGDSGITTRIIDKNHKDNPSWV